MCKSAKKNFWIRDVPFNNQYNIFCTKKLIDFKPLKWVSWCRNYLQFPLLKVQNENIAYDNENKE